MVVRMGLRAYTLPVVLEYVLMVDLPSTHTYMCVHHRVRMDGWTDRTIHTYIHHHGHTFSATMHQNNHKLVTTTAWAVVGWLVGLVGDTHRVHEFSLTFLSNLQNID